MSLDEALVRHGLDPILEVDVALSRPEGLLDIVRAAGATEAAGDPGGGAAEGVG
jgi:hypothetical protein